MQAWSKKIKAIGEQVSKLNLNYYEHLNLLNDIHTGIDTWVESRLAHFMKK